MTRLLASPLTALLEASRALLPRQRERALPAAPIERLSPHELRDIGVDEQASLFEPWQRY